MAPGLTQPLTEMSTRNLPGGKARIAHKPDNLTASVSQVSRKHGSLDVSQPYGPPQPVTGIALYLYHALPKAYDRCILNTSQACCHRDDLLVNFFKRGCIKC
jgi:hypothetical protein